MGTLSLYFLPLFIEALGIWLYKFPPKKINSFAGYRTDKSMKNQTTWIYAQKLMGKKFIKYGIFILLVTLLLTPTGALSVGITDMLLCIGLLGVVIKSELDLEKAFDSSGEFKNTYSTKEEIKKNNEELVKTNNYINTNNSVKKEDLEAVKVIINYLANFKNEDFEYFDYINHLMEDPNILELFNKYSNDELKKRLYFLTEYYKQIKFKTIVKKKTRF